MSGPRRGIRLLGASAVGMAVLLVAQAGESTGEAPRKVDSVRMMGEWTGIAPQSNLLVTLSAGGWQGPHLLTIAEHRGDEIVTDVYSVGMTVTSGVFEVGREHSVVQLRGCAQRKGVWGRGEGVLTRRVEGKVKEDVVYFFYLEHQSWMPEVIRTYRTAREFPIPAAWVPKPDDVKLAPIGVVPTYKKEPFSCPITEALPRTPRGQE